MEIRLPKAVEAEWAQTMRDVFPSAITKTGAYDLQSNPAILLVEMIRFVESRCPQFGKQIKADPDRTIALLETLVTPGRFGVLLFVWDCIGAGKSELSG